MHPLGQENWSLAKQPVNEYSHELATKSQKQPSALKQSVALLYESQLLDGVPVHSPPTVHPLLAAQTLASNDAQGAGVPAHFTAAFTHRGAPSPTN